MTAERDTGRVPLVVWALVGLHAAIMIMCSILYPATYGYPAYPAYGYGYPAAVGVAVLPAYRPFYRPWVGYRPWGYRAWGYGPRVSFGFGWRGGWR